MIGRRQLQNYAELAAKLVSDGHREGAIILELVTECHRLLVKDWTPERFRDALDVYAALFIQQTSKNLSESSTLEFIEWAISRSKKNVTFKPTRDVVTTLESIASETVSAIQQFQESIARLKPEERQALHRYVAMGYERQFQKEKEKDHE